jgi:hypothetical protein
MAKEKVKKPIFKRWWFWVVAVLIIGGIATGGAEEEQQQSEPAVANESAETEKAEETEAPAEEEKAEEEPAESKAGILDEEKFNQIKSGMTYEEVVAIIGDEGQVMSETGEKGTDFHTVMYEWEAEGSSGANANFMFQGGKLVNKAQMGVVESSDVTVTLDEFNKISNGMTYEEVVEIIGGEGDLLSESGDKGTELHTVMYMYTGEGDLGANANFMFQNNKLENKSQIGLK